MKTTKLGAWINRILATQPEEISCSECFDLVSIYVDEEMAGKISDKIWEPVRHHLGQCLVCREEYEILHDLVITENSQEK